jgi:protein kinase-like protein
VAYKKYPNDLARTPAWSHIEATGELWSKKSTIHDSQSQAAAYAAYHLQARPDLVSVAGMWITKSQFSIFFVNACRVYVSNHIKLKDQMAGPLLYAFVWYLYHPQLDKSVFIDTRVDPPKFSITLSEGQEFSNLKLKFTGSIPGRRTTVYICDSNPGLVIKEQYIEKARRFFEGTLLQKIHSQGEFPGVVRIDKYEPVRNNNQDVTVSYGDSIRFKTRLVLKDMGEPLMEVKKVGELLMALYDFLESAHFYRYPKHGR